MCNSQILYWHCPILLFDKSSYCLSVIFGSKIKSCLFLWTIGEVQNLGPVTSKNLSQSQFSFFTVLAFVELAVWVVNFEWGEHSSLIFFGNFFPINQLGNTDGPTDKSFSPLWCLSHTPEPENLCGQNLPLPSPIYYPWGIGISYICLIPFFMITYNSINDSRISQP